MKILLIRHGQTDWNLKGHIQGQKDVRLNKKGREQATSTAQKLKKEKIFHIFSTDLKRGKETAEIINQYHNVEISIDKRLREKEYGVWVGKTWDQIFEEIPEFMEHAKENPLTWHAPGGETMSQLFERLFKFLKDLKDFILDYKPKKGHNNSNILIVSHNSPIRCILSLAKGLKPHEYQKTGHVKNSEIHKLTKEQLFELDLE